MQTILSQLQSQKNWKEFIKKSCRRNKINVQIASFFTPNKIRGLYDRFQKIYEQKVEDDSTCWLENQLKAFYWFLVVLSGLRQKLIQNFCQEEWKIMKGIFKNKDQSVMEYESIKLVNQRANKNRNWSQQQTQILTSIIKQNQNSNKWNDIARKLFQRSEHNFFRSGKQCRERWLNHLDPNKKRGQWTQDQDKLIIKFILINGRRWSNIAKQLGNHRTEHMVKNRFKTLIIKQKKLMPRISNQNTLLRQIGKRILGQDAIPSKKQTIVKQQNEQSLIDQKSIDEQSMNEQMDQDYKKGKIYSKKTQFRLPCSQEIKTEKNVEVKKEEMKGAFEGLQDKNFFKDPVISHIIQDCSKAGTVSTPHSNYELQQIYSPFYINYQSIQGITPYLSPSPTLPFFMNSSFSAFDTPFNQTLFIGSTNNNGFIDKKDKFQ